MTINDILNLFDDCYMVCDLQNGKVNEIFPSFPGVNTPCNILNILRQKKFQLDINALREIDHFLAVAGENDSYNIKCKDAWYTLEILRGPHEEQVVHIYNLKNALDMVVNDLAQNQLDSLTNVLEKHAIETYVDNYIKAQKLNSATLFYLDIDYFKNINDNYGHLFGDEIIKAIAKELDKLCGTSGKVGRIGGDEFIIFVQHDLDRLGMKNVARLIRYVLDNLTINDKNFSCSATIGIAQYPKNGKSYKELFECCDKALYRGKCKGRDCHIIYDEKLHNHIKEEELISDFDSIGALSSTALIEKIVNELLANDFNEALKIIYPEIAEYFKLDRIVTVEFDGLVETRYAKIGERAGANKYQELIYAEYLNNFNGELFYVNDSLTWKKKNMDIYNAFQSANVASFIQILMKDEKENPIGFISFETQASRRVWQRGELNYLSIIAKIINSFYNKK